MSGSTIDVLKFYMRKYGGKETLQDVFIKETKNKFVCPKCKGTGEIYQEDNNLDMGGYHFSGYIKCDLCNGEGYTDKKYVTNYVQRGYKVEEERNE